MRETIKKIISLFKRKVKPLTFDVVAFSAYHPDYSFEIVPLENYNISLPKINQNLVIEIEGKRCYIPYEQMKEMYDRANLKLEGKVVPHLKRILPSF